MYTLKLGIDEGFFGLLLELTSTESGCDLSVM